MTNHSLVSTPINPSQGPSPITPMAGIAGKASGARSLGLSALTALVIGSMIGSGVFSLPQNMAAAAGPLAILISWAITGIGVLALAFVYQALSTRKPDLDSGPYAYAKAGFGPFVGFNSAWGYWLSAWIGNVSYVVVMFGALAYFFPVFGEGNSWQAIIGASIVLWLIHALILSGVRQAAIVNAVATVAKIAPILLFIVIAIVAFRVEVFTLDFSGLGDVKLGPLLTQVKSTMLVTLWVFIGIEGASVISARATRRTDIGIATIAGFLTTLAIYVLVSLLSLGILTQPELAALKNPSMSGVLEHIVGPWGAILVSVAVVVSVAGAFLSWTMLAAEIPHVAAGDGTMPRFLRYENRNGAPAMSLWFTNGLVQLLLLVTFFAHSTYLALLNISTTAILIPYALSGAYAAKLAISGEAYALGERRGRDLAAGVVATLYGIWLVYAAGPANLLMCAMLYAPGIIFYVIARREGGARSFTPVEAAFAVALVIVGGIAAWLISNGSISPL